MPARTDRLRHRYMIAASSRYLAVLVLLAVVGCSSGNGTAAVTGTVLYKNQPVDGADVSFLPKDQAPSAKAARGTTDASGRFTLTTYITPDDQPAGAMPGEYSVVITKIDQPQGAYDPHKDPPLKNHLPAKYGNAQQTPLTATVKPSANRPEFKLED